VTAPIGLVTAVNNVESTSSTKNGNFKSKCMKMPADGGQLSHKGYCHIEIISPPACACVVARLGVFSHRAGLHGVFRHLYHLRALVSDLA
jgi:hypothetical protein